MTKTDALEKSGIVVAALWPEWWRPGQKCGREFLYSDGPCEHGPWHTHEISPPNLLQAENFLRALKECVGTELWNRDFKWYCQAKRWGRIFSADTPEEALLLALFDLVTREKR